MTVRSSQDSPAGEEGVGGKGTMGLALSLLQSLDDTIAGFLKGKHKGFHRRTLDTE